MLGRLLLFCLFAAPALGADPMWTLLDRVPDADMAAAPWVRPARFQPAVLNEPVLLQTLRAAPLEFTPQGAAGLWFTIPRPDGAWETFEIVESPVMEPGLAAQFPQIKTYRGQGLDDPSATIRLDHTPQGFHAQVLSPHGAYYIDPYSRGNTTLYSVYFKRDHIAPQQWFCQTPPGEPVVVAAGYGERNASPLRTYRLACAADGEYTAFQGGTVALGQAAVVTAINRVTGVYETEMAVRMTLVANNSSIIYTDANSDPYTNNNGSTMLGQNQTTCDNVIGSANYDIGHVFSTGGGGIAGLGVVCVTGNKARGVTGNPSPVGDSFWIDYVAHEMGHQFGANHTFNSTTSNCGGGNRSASHAYEDGSGSTIMAYAGICGADDLQPHSDPYFAFDSLGAINSYITGGGACSVNTATGNTAPTVLAGSPSTIPARTPFTLTAQGSDVNGDPLTYCWEERDLGASTTLAAGDNGTSPIIRSFNPTTSPSRSVPRLSTLLGGAAAPGEILPTTTRTLNWRVTVRDNRAAAGGWGTADRTISVVNTGTPFAVTSPNTNVSWSGGQTVTWNVAGTTANGINCANVRISLSTDGGTTFPTVLLASTPNSGSAPVTLPGTPTTQARIKVEAVGNIFFDISDVNFTITAAGACGSADFNCDGDLGTDADIEAFFACLAGDCPAPPCNASADFNGDGDIGTDADIEAFFRVLAGGTC